MGYPKARAAPLGLADPSSRTPQATACLDRHQIFLTPREAVFPFESCNGESVLESLLSEPEFWKIAASWRERGRAAARRRGLYSRARGESSIDPALLPTGLHNGDDELADL